jgi:tetratricopeptide (TPR) repeat protein
LLNIASDLTKATDSSDEELIALLKNALNQLLLQGHLREAEVAGWQFFEAYKTKKEDQAARETLAQLRAIAKEYHKANNFKEAGALDLRKLRALSDIAAEPGDELQALDDLCESYLKGAEFVELAKLMPEVMNKYQDAYGEEGEEFIERKIFAVDVFSKVHEYDRATELLQTALAAATKRWGEFGEKTVALLNTLADLYNKQARYADAERLYRQVMEHQESTSDQNVGKTYTKLGEILSLQKDYEQSESFLKKALEMAEAASDAESQEVLPALMYLASLYMTTGRYKDAEPCYKRILEIKYKIYGEHSGEIIASLIHLGELYNLQNNFAESEVLLETALETAQRIYSHDDERLAAVMFQYARVLTQVGKDDEGERLHARAEKIRLGQQIQDDARQTEAQSQH